MFDGAAFCEHCGVRRGRVEQGGGLTCCPGCQSAVQQVTLGSTTLHECDACDGVWIESGEFERLCADRESQAAALPRLSRPRGPAAVDVKYRPCPRCGKLMNRVNFGRQSGAIVDVCKGHGTFLDAGELHQIVTFIHQGGLDRVRAVEKEEMKEEARSLRQAREKLARDRARQSGALSNVGGVDDAGGLLDVIDFMLDL